MKKTLAEIISERRNVQNEFDERQIREFVNGEMGKEMQQFFESLRKYCISEITTYVHIEYSIGLHRHVRVLDIGRKEHLVILRKLFKRWYKSPYFFKVFSEIGEKNEFKTDFFCIDSERGGINFHVKWTFWKPQVTTSGFLTF